MELAIIILGIAVGVLSFFVYQLLRVVVDLYLKIGTLSELISITVASSFDVLATEIATKEDPEQVKAIKNRLAKELMIALKNNTIKTVKQMEKEAQDGSK